MKKIISLLLMMTLLAVSVSAGSLERKVSECGEDITCKFRVVSESQNPRACEAFEGEMYDNCREYLGLAQKEKDPADALELEEPKSFGLNTKFDKSVSTIIGILIVTMAFIFIVVFLFFENYKYEYVKRHHSDLVAYIKKSIDDGKPLLTVKKKLQKVGWGERLINNALKDALKKK